MGARLPLKFTLSVSLAEKFRAENVFCKILDFIESPSEEVLVKFGNSPTEYELQIGRIEAEQWLKYSEDDPVLDTIVSNQTSSSAERSFDRDSGNIKYRTAGFEPLIFLAVLFKLAPINTGGKDNLTLAILLTVLSCAPGSFKPIMSYADLLTAVANFRQEATMVDIRQAHKALEDIGEDLKTGLYLTYKSNAHIRSSRASLSSSFGAVAAQENVLRSSTFRNEVLRRDNFQCILTKHTLESLENELNTADLAQVIRFERLKTSHIIPNALNEPLPNGEMSQPKKAFWGLANMFDPGLRDSLRDERSDSPSNGLTFTYTCHTDFTKLRFWFTPCGVNNLGRHVYKIEWPTNRKVFRDDELADPGRKVIFQRDGKHDAPNPRYLAFHRAIAIASHLSGVTDPLSGIGIDEDLGTCLREDGTDASLLHMKLMRL